MLQKFQADISLVANENMARAKHSQCIRSIPLLPCPSCVDATCVPRQVSCCHNHERTRFCVWLRTLVEPPGPGRGFSTPLSTSMAQATHRKHLAKPVQPEARSARGGTDTHRTAALCSGFFRRGAVASHQSLIQRLGPARRGGSQSFTVPVGSPPHLQGTTIQTENPNKR